MQLIPLQQFICDTCDGIIAQPADGMLQWRRAPNGLPTGFTITHKPHTSPRGRDVGCYTIPARVVEDVELSSVAAPHIHPDLGYEEVNGMGKLIGLFLDSGNHHEGPRVASVPEVMEVFRRLHLPHYEEARLYFAEARREGEFEGLHEWAPYTQEFLTRIIRNYGRDS